VRGRFLNPHLDATGVGELRSRALEAQAQGVDAVFLDEVHDPLGARPVSLGDPVVLAAGLASVVPRLLLGVRTTVTVDGRHPAIVARDLTCLDLVSGGRAVLCLRPPFIDGLAEVMAMIRLLWHEGVASCRAGPFRVEGAVNRPRSAEGTPLLAVDLTGPGRAGAELTGAADVVLRPSGQRGECEMAPH
jgi:alkanesulfonate monooxygenase SsuD/methylene tetrahydromethanopterin reductase-like flavin-dependent oxidoreductase (luciferase family)